MTEKAEASFIFFIPKIHPVQEPQQTLLRARIEAGFEYITERDGLKIYRKHKYQVPKCGGFIPKCGGWDLNPRTPMRQGPKPCSFDLARRPPLYIQIEPEHKLNIFEI